MKKELKDLTLDELWHLFPIFLVEHSSNWSTWYKEEETFLKSIIPYAIITHIGSTAISDIWAKPIIDILIEVPTNYNLKDIKDILVNNGLLLMHEEECRMSFNKGYTIDGFKEKVYHYHLRYVGDNDEIYFRDYLNNHIEVRLEYEKLKLSLWHKYEFNRDAYTFSKTEFVTKYTLLAKEEEKI